MALSGQIELRDSLTLMAVTGIPEFAGEHRTRLRAVAELDAREHKFPVAGIWDDVDRPVRHTNEVVAMPQGEDLEGNGRDRLYSLGHPTAAWHLDFPTG